MERGSILRVGLAPKETSDWPWVTAPFFGLNSSNLKGIFYEQGFPWRTFVVSNAIVEEIAVRLKLS